MIDEIQVKKYIRTVKGMNDDFAFYDCHTHPFDVIFDQVDYRIDNINPGVFSTNGYEFVSPKLAKLVIKQKDSGLNDESVDQALQSKISQMFIRRIYSHVGPCVFNEHTGLCGIEKSLLLPVAPASGSVENQMLSMEQFYGADDRFEAGTSIPNLIKNAEIYTFISGMIEKYGIKAVKIHPNITELNMATPQGKERLHSILSACGDLDMPLIVHGGKSKILKNSNAAEYGCIENLKDIDWGLSKSTVVIAHAGGHSCSMSEMKKDVIPAIKKMLETYENLMVDLAALDINSLGMVFRYIGPERILFGTDALYHPQWISVANVMHALTNAASNADEVFIQIASINPRKHIFKGE